MEEVRELLLKNNCELKTFTKKSENMIYICACGLEKNNYILIISEGTVEHVMKKEL